MQKWENKNSLIIFLYSLNKIIFIAINIFYLLFCIGLFNDNLINDTFLIIMIAAPIILYMLNNIFKINKKIDNKISIFLNKHINKIFKFILSKPKIFKNKRFVFSLYENIVKKIYKVPKSKHIYYKGNVKNIFLKQGINLLNDLPEIYDKLILKYPVNFKFVADKNSKYNAVYQITAEDIRTARILIFCSKKGNKIPDEELKKIILHEVSHHFDAVLSKMNLMGEEDKLFLSEYDEGFEKLFKNKSVVLDDYFLSNKKEYFAETLCLYFLKELKEEDLVKYYDFLIKKFNQTI